MSWHNRMINTPYMEVCGDWYILGMQVSWHYRWIKTPYMEVCRWLTYTWDWMKCPDITEWLRHLTWRYMKDGYILEMELSFLAKQQESDSLHGVMYGIVCTWDGMKWPGITEGLGFLTMRYVGDWYIFGMEMESKLNCVALRLLAWRFVSGCYMIGITSGIILPKWR